MSSRYYKHPYTQGVRHIWLPVTVLPNGSGVPTLGEGDKAGSYFTVAHTSTGIITLTTIERFLALVTCTAQITLATAAGAWTCQPQATASSTNTWAIALNLFSAGTLTDIAAATGNAIYVNLCFRNSIGVP